MKNVIDFLAELRLNNNRDWFEANRAWFKDAQGEFFAFTEQLIVGIAKIDSSVEGVALKDCTYRIYRDTRFSHDKTPYKTYMGSYVCPKGKKSGYAGYYFHIEPKGDDGLIGGNLLSAGLYAPEPKVLKSVRDEIFDNGAMFVAAVNEAEGFQLDPSPGVKLQRVPNGYPKDSEYAEYLKYKDFSLWQYVSNDFILSDNLLDNVIGQYRKTVTYNKLLNRAVEFAHNEM